MGTMGSLITSLTIVYSTVYLCADQRKHLRVTGLCVVNSPGIGEFPAQMASNAQMFPFDDVIIRYNPARLKRATACSMNIWLTGSCSEFELTKDTTWHAGQSQNVKYEWIGKHDRHTSRIYCIPCFFSVPDSRFRKVFFKYFQKKQKTEW